MLSAPLHLQAFAILFLWSREIFLFCSSLLKSRRWVSIVSSFLPFLHVLCSIPVFVLFVFSFLRILMAFLSTTIIFRAVSFVPNFLSSASSSFFNSFAMSQECGPFSLVVLWYIGHKDQILSWIFESVLIRFQHYRGKS